MNVKNKYFIKNYNFLKSKGIDVSYTMKVNNERLLTLDPYNNDLTMEDKRDIIEECSTNIWYFLREIVRIYVPGDIDYFRINSSITALVNSVDNNLDVVWMNSRLRYSYITLTLIKKYFNLFRKDRSYREYSFSDQDLNKDFILPEYIKNIEDKTYDVRRDRIPKRKIENLFRGHTYDDTIIVDSEELTPAIIQTLTPVKQCIRKSRPNSFSIINTFRPSSEKVTSEFDLMILNLNRHSPRLEYLLSENLVEYENNGFILIKVDPYNYLFGDDEERYEYIRDQEIFNCFGDDDVILREVLLK